METERNFDTYGNFDARILSLCSRSIGSGVPVDFSGENVFYSFSYYDAIRVDRVVLNDCAQLKDAYITACSMRRKDQRNEIPQSIVAIADISSSPDAFGYTAEEIRCFWDDTTAPIFFVSMINLSRTTDLEKILGDIKKKFSSQTHLAYLTFDHCDIIIFGRGDSFERYTKCIFDLCYAGTCVPEDIITIYGFSNQKALYAQQERETFQACIRLGIRDYRALDRIAPKCADNPNAREFEGKKIYVSWLLGRNDINFCCPNASLPWLSKVRNALIKSTDGEPWYTTYDLMVLMEERSLQWQTPHHFPRDLGALTAKMECLYKEFYEAYTNQYQRLNESGDVYYPDQVWCRWLMESSRLAVSLIGNPLSSDFGTCLVPQFLDLLDYGRRLFGKEGRLLSQAEIETAHENFAKFFSSTAILVDSLNQTNRQFVQVPAFHLPSFEVQSQIMAYYTAVAYRILNVLKDKPSYFYGLSISPNLVNTLSVSSFALPVVLENDEWLSIHMDEESFYTLKLTTETLGHEISHFIGEGNRNREKRKECLIQWAFQELIGTWFVELVARISELCRLPDQQVVAQEQYPSWDALSKAAGELCALAQETDNRYKSKKNNQIKYVKDLIWDMAADVCRNIPELRERAFDQIWEILCIEPAGRALKTQVQHYIYWEIGLDCSKTQQMTDPIQDWTIDKLVKDKVKNLFFTILEDIAELFRRGGQCQNSMQQDMQDKFREKVFYLFSETFADLQVIMLLDMKWADYCMLLKRDKDRKLIEDCPPRMLAVVRALVDRNVWNPKEAPFTFGGKEFDDVKKFALVPFEDFITSLYGSTFDPVLIHYLTEYLKTCIDSIQEYFKPESRKADREDIRKMYRVLAAPSSMLSLQKGMLDFVSKYQTECLCVK